MRAIRARLVALSLSGILCMAIIISMIGLFNAADIATRDAERVMNLICEEKANSINAQLIAIEESVNTVAMSIIQSYKKNHSFSKEFFEPIYDVALQYVSGVPGGNAFFLILDKKRFPDMEGFNYVKRIDDGVFESQTDQQFLDTTGINLQKIQGYTEPIEKGESVWIAPYANDFLQTQILSYSVPLYDEDNLLLGVLMLDVRLDLLKDMVSNTSVYDNGYAFLADADGKVVFHKELSFGENMYEIDESLKTLQNALKNSQKSSKLFSYTYQEEKRCLAFTEIRNGLRLIVTVPSDELYSEQRRMLGRVMLPTVMICIAFTFLSLAMTYKIVQPLKELTEAAKKISEGDMSAELTYHGEDEIGILSDSFRHMSDSLKRYIRDINSIAYHDALTGVNNKAAYQEKVAELEKQINNGNTQFAIVVFDLNNLKTVNDTMGHTCGDKMIAGACDVISNVFHNSPIYRIGGDEFVAILEGADYQHRNELLKSMSRKTEIFNRSSDLNIKVSIAKGMAEYTEDLDKGYNDIFMRADARMYKNKVQMKKDAEGDKKQRS